MVWYQDKHQLHLGDGCRYHVQFDASKTATPPSVLYLRIKNTERLGVRAVHLLSGPFTFYCHVVPVNYDHRVKFNQGEDPEVKFKYQVKPGKLFNMKLLLNANSELRDRPGVYQWDIDILLMIVISKRPTVTYEMVIGPNPAELKMVTLILLQVELAPKSETDPITVKKLHTDEIWATPPRDPSKDIHLVILTHGIFSNVTDDLLYVRDQIVEHATDNVLVRGYEGNRGKTERGVERQGRRVGAYVLELIDSYHGRITKLLFIGHSLGGLVQLYAIKYMLLSRGDDYFTKNNIELDNFVCLALPLLGVLTEMSFIILWFLDLGSLGKTGRDLTLAKKHSLWGGEDDTTSRPFLETLPDEPLQTALRLFNHRTVYANAVNDGIVPLRTLAILYLDYGALGDVNKIKENQQLDKAEHDVTKVTTNDEHQVEEVPYESSQTELQDATLEASPNKRRLRHDMTRKELRVLAMSGRGIDPNSDDSSEFTSDRTDDDEEEYTFNIPPKASLVQLALNSLINPVPLMLFVTDPSSRDPVIFHDKYYCFKETPQIPESKTVIMSRVFQNKDWKLKKQVKIALKYHSAGCTWRKVLVNLPPDAHNNIVVRRRFANGFGWGVIDHMTENLFCKYAGLLPPPAKQTEEISNSPPKL